MTEYYHKKGNRIIKYAFLTAIKTLLEKNNLIGLEFEDNAFDKESDRVKFTSAGHKCRLFSIGMPDTDNALLPMIVRTDWEGEKDVEVSVTLHLSDIHIKTIENICYEVYDWLRREDDDDWHEFRKELVAGWLDTDLYR